MCIDGLILRACSASGAKQPRLRNRSHLGDRAETGADDRTATESPMKHLKCAHGFRSWADEHLHEFETAPNRGLTKRQGGGLLLRRWTDTIL